MLKLLLSAVCPHRFPAAPLLCSVPLLLVMLFTTCSVYAQSASDKKSPSEKGPGTKTAETAEDRANAALNSPSTEAPAPKPSDAANETKGEKASFLDFYLKGGPLMYPITILSLIAILFTIERVLALRRVKVVPTALVNKLGETAAAPGGLDPRKAYKLCQQYPSSAANVVRAMLLKAGRPNSEIEEAIKTTSDREASRLYGNVRPIALAYTVAPMLGLLGTTLGMIILFHDAATAPTGGGMANKLADGIYTKLITTFSGLCVAIPAVIAAQLLEAKIISMFHDIGDLAQSLVPQLERYEGKLRVTSKQLTEDSEPPSSNGNGTPQAPVHAKG